MATPAWVFGSLLILFLMAVVSVRLFIPTIRIDQTTQNILGLLAALLCGLFGFFMTGTVSAAVAPSGGAGITIQATGGAALFVIVLWWWRSSQPLKASPDVLDAVGRALNIVDDVYPGLSAVAQDRDERAHGYSQRAQREGQRIVVRDTKTQGTVMTITADDLANLPDDTKKYITAKQQSMESAFNKWVKLYPHRAGADGKRRKDVGRQLSGLARSMCADLTGILNHLGSVGYELQDHYSAVRSICYELESTATGAARD